MRSAAITSLGRWALAASIVGVLLISSGCSRARAGSDTSGSAESHGWFASLFSTSPRPLNDCPSLFDRWSDEKEAFTATAKNSSGTFQLHYRAAACVACEEQRSATFTDAAWRTRYQELAASEMYVLRATVKDGATWDVTDDSLMYRFKEVAGRDTVPCAFAQVEASASMVPYSTVILGFDRPQDVQDRTVLFDAPGGRVRFTFGHGLLTRFSAAAGDTLSKQD